VVVNVLVNVLSKFKNTAVGTEAFRMYCLNLVLGTDSCCTKFQKRIMLCVIIFIIGFFCLESNSINMWSSFSLGIPLWAAPFSQLQKAMITPWAAAGRSGLDSISLFGLPCGR